MREADKTSYDEPAPMPSLPEVHRSVGIPKGSAFWRKVLAFSGPGFLVAVGYMDPGNWATDIAGGSQFAYQLIFVLFISNLLAILVQALAARLGVVTQLDLAQACRSYYSRRTSLVFGCCVRSPSRPAIWRR